MKIFFTKFWSFAIVMTAVTVAQPTRPDAIWGKQIPNGAITLDGILNEAAWAKADSIVMKWNGNAGDPGSGQTKEGGVAVPTDPIDATLKFLVSPNGKLYIGVYAKDKSVGGGGWAQFDAMLFNLRDKKWKDQNTLIASPYEFFYGWVAEGWADPTLNTGNKPPGFFGWSNGHRDSTSGHDRDKGAKNKDIWNAVTKVIGGEVNNDSTGGQDQAWVTEFEIDLPRRGYDVANVNGDILMFSLALWDSDYRWPLDTSKVNSARAWVQGPWGNASAYSHLRIFTNPSVTTSTTNPGALPYDLTIYNGVNHSVPTIDGQLTENVWKSAPSYDIRFGDAAVRNSYKNTIPFRSGQFQPEVYGKKESIVDPADANVKMFFKADTLYVGIHVKDKAVQFRPEFDRQDGFRFMPKSRTERDDIEKYLTSREIIVRIDSSANKYALEGYSKVITSDTIANKGSKIVLGLNTGTTVDTLGNNIDNGYNIEMKLNLRALGYSAGRNDGLFWFGGLLFDGDSFGSTLPPYGNRVWIAQEGTWPDGPLCAYLDVNSIVTSVDPSLNIIPEKFELFGAYPNPFNPTTNIEFSLPQVSNVKIQVFDIIGRVIAEKTIYGLSIGRQAYHFDATGLTSGSYIYRIQMLDGKTNQELSSKVGKMILMK
ncbi:MAG: T9SS type A sorting domain-containing protein [Bacteroidota bacterium]